jgi:hypothetical protein
MNRDWPTRALSCQVASLTRHTAMAHGLARLAEPVGGMRRAGTAPWPTRPGFADTQRSPDGRRQHGKIFDDPGRRE